MFLKEGQDLIYETAVSIPKNNKIDGIESTLPYATIARFYPGHPILKEVEKAWNEYKKENGMVTDGVTITAEGCYTVAYPMAVLGKEWNRKDLKLAALEQLKHREVLIDSRQFYLRYTEGERTYQNWARGAAWFLIGYARTISELKDELDCSHAIEVFQKSVENVLAFQRENGLWGCFMHDDNIAIDTSGSAGICAAIATGMKEGFLFGDYSIQIKKCYNSLLTYLTPDGFLKGVAQDNRGGIELQQSDYRVIAQMGMGLMAQLHAYS